MKTIKTKFTNYFKNYLIDIINDKVNEDELENLSDTYHYEIEDNYFGNEIIIDAKVSVDVTVEYHIEYLNTGFGDVAYNVGVDLTINAWELNECAICNDYWEMKLTLNELNEIKF